LGTTGDAFARKWQRRLKLDLREFNTAEVALRAAKAGQVAAAIVDPIALYDFQRAGDLSLKSVGKSLADELYIVAVRRNTTTLLQQINAAIDAMKRDGSLDELQKKWF
jgi:polar amino acid transport system substrate-binding protein